MGKVITSLQWDILKRHAGPFVFCFMTIMFLLLMQFLIQFIEHLVGKDIPFLVIIELILTNLAYMVVLAVPMAVLVATLIAFGKFSENSELTAVKAAGIHPFRLILPVLGAAMMISILLMWFSNEVLPESNYKARALFLDIRMKKPGFDLKENEFYDGLEGYTFLVRHIPPGTDSLHQIILFQDAIKQRDKAVIKAKRGYLTSQQDLMLLTLNLYDGTIMRYLQDGIGRQTMLEETTFERYRISFDISDLSFSRTNPERRRRDGRTMRAQAMKAAIDTLAMEIEKDYSDYLYATQSLNFMPEEKQTEPEVTSNIQEQSPSFVPTEREDLTLVIAGRNPAELSEFVALNAIPHLELQRSIAQRGVMGFRTTLADFENMMNAHKWRTERQASFWVEINKKVSIPFACIIFVLVGAPLGMLTKKGNLGVNALIATILFTFYWISIIQGEKLADRLVISPFMGMWFANIILMIAGLLLVLKISKEYNAFRLG